MAEIPRTSTSSSTTAIGEVIANSSGHMMTGNTVTGTSEEANSALSRIVRGKMARIAPRAIGESR